jgi:hypothetical protein
VEARLRQVLVRRPLREFYSILDCRGVRHRGAVG